MAKKNPAYVDPRKVYGPGGIFGSGPGQVQPDPINLPPGYDWNKDNQMSNQPFTSGPVADALKAPETRTAPMSGHAGAAEIYDMLVNSLNQSSIKGQIGTDWLTTYKDKLIGSIIPAAQNAYGNAGIQNAFQNYWRKAILMAYSAATGKPFYDKTGDGSRANLLYIPGYDGYGPPTVNSDEAEYIV